MRSSFKRAGDEASAERYAPVQVDGVKNAKVQSIYLEDLPIHKAAFANGGSQVIDLCDANIYPK